MNDELQKILDISIAAVELPTDDPHPASGFWHAANIDDNMALAVRKLIDSVHVQQPVSHDIEPFVEKIEKRHKHDTAVSDEQDFIEPPYELDDYLAECTPQFILRNIPKLERYYDLDRPLPFMLDTTPIKDALTDVEDVRHARLDPPEFSDHDNVEFLNDFRVFLEEIFVLCPWEQITRRAPDEDSPWHFKNSSTKLAKYMLENKNTFFVFGTHGMKSIQLGDYQTETKDNKENSHSGGIGVPTFGPG